MIRSITSDDIAAEELRAKLYCDHFNSWINGSGLMALLFESRLSSRPPVTIAGANVGLGAAYNTCFQSWFQEAVGVGLVEACDRDGKRFTSGSLGSIWMDATLTGQLPDGTSKPKDVRIALVPKEAAALGPKMNAVRVVEGKATLVKVKKQADEADSWLVSGGEKVSKSKLFPMHVLSANMQYLMVVDPMMDLQDTF